MLDKYASIRSKLMTAACWSREITEENLKQTCFMSKAKATSVPQLGNHSQYSSHVGALNLIDESKSLPVEANNSTIKLQLPVETKEKIVMIDESKSLPEETDNFAEDLAEIEPTITDMTTKETTISIIRVKSISLYYACSACGRNTEQSGKLLKCNSCNLRQRITPEAKHWFAKVFAQDTGTKSNFYLNIFHQQMVKLFEATDKNLHTGLSKEDLGDRVAEIDDLKVTYNCVDGKLLHVN